MSRQLTFSELLREKPKRYEITPDHKFLFELPDGETVELKCEACDGNLWQIGIKEDKGKKIAFRIICLNCPNGFYYLWMEPGKPPESSS